MLRGMYMRTDGNLGDRSEYSDAGCTNIGRQRHHLQVPAGGAVSCACQGKPPFLHASFPTTTPKAQLTQSSQSQL